MRQHDSILVTAVTLLLMAGAGPQVHAHDGFDGQGLQGKRISGEDADERRVQSNL